MTSDTKTFRDLTNEEYCRMNSRYRDVRLTCTPEITRLAKDKRNDVLDQKISLRSFMIFAGRQIRLAENA